MLNKSSLYKSLVNMASFNFASSNPVAYKLVMLRHGESVWNKENRFTGWKDV
jgi:hypothetical protein